MTKDGAKRKDSKPKEGMKRVDVNILEKKDNSKN